MVSWDWQNLDMATNQSFPGGGSSTSSILTTQPVIANPAKTFSIQDVLASQHDRLQSPSIHFGKVYWLVTSQQRCVELEFFSKCSTVVRRVSLTARFDYLGNNFIRKRLVMNRIWRVD